MLTPETWWSNMNGPTPTGSVPKFVPSLASCVGDITTPTFVARIGSSGVKRCFRWITTVYSPRAATVWIGVRLARAARVRKRDVALERDDDRLGVERSAVVELDALAERDRVGEPVRRDRRQGARELGIDVALRVEVVEALGDRPEDQHGGERDVDSGVERVGIAMGQADDENAPVPAGPGRLGRRPDQNDKRPGKAGQNRHPEADTLRHRPSDEKLQQKRILRVSVG